MADNKDNKKSGYIPGSGNPFPDPGYTNGAYDLNEKEAAKFKDALSEITNKAKDETDSAYEEVHNKKGTELYPWANSNIARTGGEKGHINNRNYGRTLRLAREADAYNNRPVDHIFSVGTRHTGGVKDLGTGYDRPRIQTMETRAMDQAFQLDTEAKSADIALQAAIKRKDLDAFIAAWQQKYGIVLTKEQAGIEMTKFLRTNQITDYFQKNLARFHALWNRYLSADTARAIDSLVRSGDDQFAAYLSQILTGTASRSTIQAAEQACINTHMLNTCGYGWQSRLSEPYVRNEYNRALSQITLEEIYNTGKMESAIKKAAKGKEYNL